MSIKSFTLINKNRIKPFKKIEVTQINQFLLEVFLLDQ